MFELTLPVLLDDLGDEIPYVINIAKNGFLTVQHTAYMSQLVPFLYTEMQVGNDLTIEIDGVNLVSGNLPFLYPSAFVDNNRTLVPVRAVAEELGYTVYWENENQEIRLVSSNGSQIVIMNIGLNDFTIINRFSLTGATHTPHTFMNNVTPTLKDGFTFLPIRSLAEALGFTVDWDENTRTVIITS